LPDELEQPRKRKADVLALLQREAVEDDTWADGVLDGPRGLCEHQPLVWVEDWPPPGEARWLCNECTRQPAPSLAAVLAGLTDAERVGSSGNSG
jgi:hypothetical protein